MEERIILIASSLVIEGLMDGKLGCDMGKNPPHDLQDKVICFTANPYYEFYYLFVLHYRKMLSL